MSWKSYRDGRRDARKEANGWALAFAVISVIGFLLPNPTGEGLLITGGVVVLALVIRHGVAEFLLDWKAVRPLNAQEKAIAWQYAPENPNRIKAMPPAQWNKERRVLAEQTISLDTVRPALADPSFPSPDTVHPPTTED